MAGIGRNQWLEWSGIRISLIFNAQRHRLHVKEAAFRIELILPQKAGEYIKNDCSYLNNVTPIGYITDGQFADYKEDLPPDSEMNNVFAYWLKEKINYHRRQKELGVGQLRPAMAQIAGETT